MKISTITPTYKSASSRNGFSLVEVVLAMGIFLVTVLALVGLLGPTLQSVDEVEKTDEVSSIVNTVNAYLQSSPDIAPGASKFDAIYTAVSSGDYATMFVFRKYIDATNPDLELMVGFSEEDDGVDTGTHLARADYSSASGPIYRVVLTPSSVLPTPTGEATKYRSLDRDDTTKTYTLNASLANYDEGYFAMEVRIYAEVAPTPGARARFDHDKSLRELAEVDPLITYNTAIVR